MAKKTLEVLESFFGGLMLLPEPGTTPDTISSVFSNLRARALDSNECYSCARLDQNPKAKLPVDSPALVTRLVSCRAKVASVLRDLDRRSWWLAAMDLYEAFLFSQGPSSRLERVCAFDLYHYRDKPI
ncbi:hypothetical protein F4824DRAFT_504239 [Ustulina deusta]|nr:hypothetical protein F4824DRAFT_504239 [Ustulina deusta]